MGIHKPVLAISACLVTAAAAPAVADAARWHGTTEQGRAAAVRTGADGRVRSVSIAWRARCRHGRYTSVTRFVRPLDVSERGRFRDGSPPVIRKRLRGGLHARVRAYASGHLTARRNWRGTFHVDVGVFRGDTRIDTCHLRDDRWTAARVATAPGFTG
jgi:hypothetical protein